MENDEEIYDAIIVGGGMSGLVTAYMLRDQRILLLERDGRLGGRVETAMAGDVAYNVGTQFFNDAATSFVDLVNELGIERTHLDPMSVPIAVYVNGQLHDGLRFLMSPGTLLGALKVWSKAYRASRIFLGSHDDPRWHELASRTLAQLQQGDPPTVRTLINAYLRGACVSKPERTSAGIGALLTLDIFKANDVAFAVGGTQSITDAMATRLEHRVVSGAEVVSVTEIDGLVTTRYRRERTEYAVTSRAAVVSTPPPITLDIVPNLPERKRRALERIDYGPIVAVTVFFDRSIPWQRWSTLLCADAVFSGATDVTYGTEADADPANPVICNFFVSIPPDDKDEIRQLLAASDEDIVSSVIADLERVLSDERVAAHMIDAGVTRYPIGELELSPEYYRDLLPDLPTPFGNIHFCGDYTHPYSFLEGAALSGFRAARELGSRHVVSDEDEVAFFDPPRWGPVGVSALGSAALLTAAGLLRGGRGGLSASIAGGALFAATASYPFLLPPHRRVYAAVATTSALLGGIISMRSRVTL